MYNVEEENSHAASQEDAAVANRRKLSNNEQVQTQATAVE